MIVIFQHYLHIVSSLHRLRLHAQVANNQLGICRNVKLEMTIYIGDGTRVSAFHSDSGSHNGLTVITGSNSTTNIRLSYRTPQEEEETAQKHH